MLEVLIYNMGTERNKIERWLNQHNHTMELIRSLVAIIVLPLQIYNSTSFVWVMNKLK